MLSLRTTWDRESFLPSDGPLGHRETTPDPETILTLTDRDSFSVFNLGSLLNPMVKIKDSRRRKAVDAQKAQHGEKQPEGSTLKKNEKFLIQNFNGVLKSGEMAFVVGRPGAGCTTFLKVRSLLCRCARARARRSRRVGN